MANILTTTGPYLVNSVSGFHTSNPYATFTFCSAFITAAGTYVSTPGDPSICDFGNATLSEVFIVNTGTNDLAFQWKEKWGTSIDSGFVAKGTTTILRRTFKTGLKVRCADASLTTTCVVWGI